MLVIKCVCGCGLGSGLLLKMNIDELLRKEYGLKPLADFDIEVLSGGECARFRHDPPDLFVTSEEYEPGIHAACPGVPIITMLNFMNNNELREKIIPVLNKILGKKKK